MDKQGHRRDYSSVYLRRTYRVEGKVKNETVANLSALPAGEFSGDRFDEFVVTTPSDDDPGQCRTQLTRH